MPPLTDPPTPDTLRHAQLHLQATLDAKQALDSKIRDAETALAHLINEAQCAITKMSTERGSLEQEAAQTKAYLSPVRRLPAELLREIFMWNFEAHAACAWVLSTVCSSWRRLAIGTPRLWSKIRLITTPTSSPELIRLWLERSGHTVPLDIEIYLRVVDQGPSANSNLVNANQRRRRRSSGSLTTTTTGLSPWTGFISSLNGVAVPQSMPVSIFPAPPSAPALVGNALGTASVMVSLPPLFSQDSTGASTGIVGRPNIHWAHIAFYYLIEQMPRWERFVFRYDKAFKSMTALASINGDAPLLKEFEVSSAESNCTSSDWGWLPNAQSPPPLPSLTSLTLQLVPFKWCSPLFSSSLLKHLNLRAPLNPALPLDRVRYIVAQCTENLESLSLYFTGVLQNVLPLTPLKLDGVKTLRVGGHWLMSQLVDCLVLPNLRVLSLLVEPREPSEDVISGLLTRSATPPGSTSTNIHPGHIPVIPLEELSLGYDTPPWTTHPSSLSQITPYHAHSHSHTHSHPHPHATFIPYYIPSPLGLITSTTSWRTLLSQLPHLRILKVGGMQIESLLISLGTFDDDTTSAGGGGAGGGGSGMNGWSVPHLEVLKMRVGCTGAGQGVFSSEVVSRLVAVVEARNPDAGGVGGTSSGSGSGSGIVVGGGGWGNGGGGGWGNGGGGWGLGGGSGSGASASASAAGVKRLKCLEVQDCELGVDVESWLGRRVESVVCVDPLYNACDRTSRRRRYF